MLINRYVVGGYISFLVEAFSEVQHSIDIEGLLNHQYLGCAIARVAVEIGHDPLIVVGAATELQKDFCPVSRSACQSIGDVDSHPRRDALRLQQLKILRSVVLETCFGYGESRRHQEKVVFGLEVSRSRTKHNSFSGDSGVPRRKAVELEEPEHQCILIPGVVRHVEITV